MSETTTSSEKRAFSRILFDADVVVQGKEQRAKTNLIDISLKGALVKAPEGFSVTMNENYTLEILLTNNGPVATLEVKAVHVENDHIGFYIHHIDIDSIAHLRSIVELNLANPELLDRELSSLG